MQTFTVVFRSQVTGSIHVTVFRRSCKSAAYLAAVSYANFVGGGVPLRFMFV